MLCMLDKINVCELPVSVCIHGGKSKKERAVDSASGFKLSRRLPIVSVPKVPTLFNQTRRVVARELDALVNLGDREHVMERSGQSRAKTIMLQTKADLNIFGKKYSVKNVRAVSFAHTVCGCCYCAENPLMACVVSCTAPIGLFPSSNVNTANPLILKYTGTG
jgi:hypothetical protein